MGSREHGDKEFVEKNYDEILKKSGVERYYDQELDKYFTRPTMELESEG